MRRTLAVNRPEPPESACGAPGEGVTNPQEIHAHCCEIAQVLLAGLAGRDLSLVEEQVVLLRKSLARLPRGETAAASGDTLLRLEQLDALEGVAEQMEGCVKEIRQAADAGFERMLSVQGLLRHLVDCPRDSFTMVGARHAADLSKLALAKRGGSRLRWKGSPAK